MTTELETQIQAKRSQLSKLEEEIRVLERAREILTANAVDRPLSLEPSIKEPEGIPVGEAPEHGALDGWVELDAFVARMRPQKLRFPDESIRPIRFWYEIPGYVAQYLVDKGFVTQSDLPVRVGRADEILIGDSSQHPDVSFHRPLAISSGLWFEKHGDAGELVEKAKYLVGRFWTGDGAFYLAS